MSKSVKVALVVVMAVFLAALLVAPVAASVKVGSSVPAIEWQWVEVMNPDGVNSGNGHFAFGETAGIGQSEDHHCDGVHRNITVIKLDASKVLCKYTTSVKAYGSECPSGAIFFMDNTEFSRQLAAHEKQVRGEQERARQEAIQRKGLKEHVKQLLKTK